MVSPETQPRSSPQRKGGVVSLERELEVKPCFRNFLSRGKRRWGILLLSPRLLPEQVVAQKVDTTDPQAVASASPSSSEPSLQPAGFVSTKASTSL
ncbi:hypothetical protein BSKO_07251 [Bryopsis sp. KO-2023]|nr:hypothetical protein BSKO_07251 [Bryopsis sp. KO-2023]